MLSAHFDKVYVQLYLSYYGGSHTTLQIQIWSEVSCAIIIQMINGRNCAVHFGDEEADSICLYLCRRLTECNN